MSIEAPTWWGWRWGARGKVQRPKRNAPPAPGGADVIKHAACPSMPPRRWPVPRGPLDMSKVWLIRHRVTAITSTKSRCCAIGLPYYFILRFRFQFPVGVWPGEILNCHFLCILHFVSFTKEFRKLRPRELETRTRFLRPTRCINIWSQHKCAAKHKYYNLGFDRHITQSRMLGSTSWRAKIEHVFTYV